LLLRESAAVPPISTTTAIAYRSVYNVSANYRWDVGMYLPGTTAPDLGPTAADLAFAIAPRPIQGIPTGSIVEPAFWDGESPPEPGSAAFRYARIPPTTAPERVLERLAALR
jgi:hypothetical protein